MGNNRVIFDLVVDGKGGGYLSSLSEALKKYEIPKESAFIVFNVIQKHPNNPFITLVSIILSQNTSDRNAMLALERMEKYGMTSPEAILKAGYQKVLEAVYPSGMGKIKARRILNISQIVLENGDFLEKVCELGEKGKELLMQLEGVGLKTADVFMISYCNYPSFPVDRHIARITERIVGRKMKYEEISNFWKEKLGASDYKIAHMKLIAIGRDICRKRNPKCGMCPLREFCASKRG
ncbi:MAG: hypothetical protein QXL07_04765 [Fervidicoccaceae archaeon]